MTIDVRPVLVFDSGVGGLSILGHIRDLLPRASIVYAADNAWLPYGAKSEAELAARVPALLGRLAERYRPRIIVIACNTAATIALSHVRDALDLPVVGTVPAIKPAALATRTGVFGLLGTEATIRQPYVDRLETEFAAGKTLLRHAAPDLVTAAEAKLRGEPVDPAVYASAIAGLTRLPGGDQLDTIVLGCTHFPLVRAELAVTAPGVEFIDSGEGIARRTAFLTSGQGWPVAPNGRAMFTQGGSEVDRLLPALERYGLIEVDVL